MTNAPDIVKPPAKVHVFADSLALSHAFAEADWWERAYRAGIPGFQSMSSVRADGWAQRGGIDRIVTLKSGKTVLVDEKVRSHAWPDFLLERWSDRDRRRPGWIQKDLACDFIAYAFVETKVCHLLPYLPLRAAWLRHGREWVRRYPTILANNPGYVTESVAVPIPVVMAAIAGAMAVSWDEMAAA